MGYTDGRAESLESHDNTWTSQGSSSEYERGWNDGYDGIAPTESPIIITISGTEQEHHSLLRQLSYELAIERKHIH
jgi:hypothetical protein